MFKKILLLIIIFTGCSDGNLPEFQQNEPDPPVKIFEMLNETPIIHSLFDDIDDREFNVKLDELASLNPELIISLMRDSADLSYGDNPQFPFMFIESANSMNKLHNAYKDDTNTFDMTIRAMTDFLFIDSDVVKTGISSLQDFLTFVKEETKLFDQELKDIDVDQIIDLLDTVADLSEMAVSSDIAETIKEKLTEFKDKDRIEKTNVLLSNTGGLLDNDSTIIPDSLIIKVDGDELTTVETSTGISTADIVISGTYDATGEINYKTGNIEFTSFVPDPTASGLEIKCDYNREFNIETAIKDIIKSLNFSKDANEFGDGFIIDFTATLDDNLPITPGTIKVYVGDNLISGIDIDNEDDTGNITGADIDGTGAINYLTGAISFTLNTPPDEDIKIKISYNNQVKNIEDEIILWLKEDQEKIDIIDALVEDIFPLLIVVAGDDDLLDDGKELLEKESIVFSATPELLSNGTAPVSADTDLIIKHIISYLASDIEKLEQFDDSAEPGYLDIFDLSAKLLSWVDTDLLTDNLNQVLDLNLSANPEKISKFDINSLLWGDANGDRVYTPTPPPLPELPGPNTTFKGLIHIATSNPDQIDTNDGSLVKLSKAKSSDTAESSFRISVNANTGQNINLSYNSESLMESLLKNIWYDILDNSFNTTNNSLALTRKDSIEYFSSTEQYVQNYYSKLILNTKNAILLDKTGLWYDDGAADEMPLLSQLLYVLGISSGVVAPDKIKGNIIVEDSLKSMDTNIADNDYLHISTQIFNGYPDLEMDLRALGNNDIYRTSQAIDGSGGIAESDWVTYATQNITPAFELLQPGIFRKRTGGRECINAAEDTLIPVALADGLIDRNNDTILDDKDKNDIIEPDECLLENATNKYTFKEGLTGTIEGISGNFSPGQGDITGMIKDDESSTTAWILGQIALVCWDGYGPFTYKGKAPNGSTCKYKNDWFSDWYKIRNHYGFIPGIQDMGPGLEEETPPEYGRYHIYEKIYKANHNSTTGTIRVNADDGSYTTPSATEITLDCKTKAEAVRKNFQWLLNDKKIFAVIPVHAHAEKNFVGASNLFIEMFMYTSLTGNGLKGLLNAKKYPSEDYDDTVLIGTHTEWQNNNKLDYIDANDDGIYQDTEEGENFTDTNSNNQYDGGIMQNAIWGESDLNGNIKKRDQYSAAWNFYYNTIQENPYTVLPSAMSFTSGDYCLAMDYRYYMDVGWTFINEVAPRIADLTTEIWNALGENGFMPEILSSNFSVFENLINMEYSATDILSVTEAAHNGTPSISNFLKFYTDYYNIKFDSVEGKYYLDEINDGSYDSATEKLISDIDLPVIPRVDNIKYPTAYDADGNVAVAAWNAYEGNDDSSEGKFEQMILLTAIASGTLHEDGRVYVYENGTGNRWLSAGENLDQFLSANSDNRIVYFENSGFRYRINDLIDLLLSLNESKKNPGNNDPLYNSIPTPLLNKLIDYNPGSGTIDPTKRNGILPFLLNSKYTNLQNFTPIEDDIEELIKNITRRVFNTFDMTKGPAADIQPYYLSEPFTDSDSNGVYDTGEPFIDWNNSGTIDWDDKSGDGNYQLWERGEEYTDVNGNNVYDDAETFIDANNNSVIDWDDTNSDGIYQDTETGESFTDADSNNQYDTNFIDLNGNKKYDAITPNAGVIPNPPNPGIDWDQPINRLRYLIDNNQIDLLVDLFDFLKTLSMQDGFDQLLDLTLDMSEDDAIDLRAFLNDFNYSQFFDFITKNRLNDLAIYYNFDFDYFQHLDITDLQNNFDELNEMLVKYLGVNLKEGIIEGIYEIDDEIIWGKGEYTKDQAGSIDGDNSFNYTYTTVNVSGAEVIFPGLKEYFHFTTDAGTTFTEDCKDYTDKWYKGGTTKSPNIYNIKNFIPRGDKIVEEITEHSTDALLSLTASHFGIDQALVDGRPVTFTDWLFGYDGASDIGIKLKKELDYFKDTLLGEIYNSTLTVTDPNDTDDDITDSFRNIIVIYKNFIKDNIFEYKYDDSGVEKREFYEIVESDGHDHMINSLLGIMTRICNNFSQDYMLYGLTESLKLFIHEVDNVKPADLDHIRNLVANLLYDDENRIPTYALTNLSSYFPVMTDQFEGDYNEIVDLGISGFEDDGLITYLINQMEGKLKDENNWDIFNEINFLFNKQIFLNYTTEDTFWWQLGDTLDDFADVVEHNESNPNKQIDFFDPMY